MKFQPVENIKQRPEDYFLSLLENNKVKAFEFAFDTFWKDLYKHATSKVHCEIMAKDLVQEVFIVLWLKMEQFNVNQNVPAFLFATLRHKILKTFEKNQVHLKYVQYYHATALPVEAHAAQILIVKELQLQLNTEIAALPQRMRKVYQLKSERGFSIKEIADNLSISEQTVRNQLCFAYSRIRYRLSGYR